MEVLIAVSLHHTAPYCEDTKQESRVMNQTCIFLWTFKLVSRSNSMHSLGGPRFGNSSFWQHVCIPRAIVRATVGVITSFRADVLIAAAVSPDALVEVSPIVTVPLIAIAQAVRVAVRAVCPAFCIHLAKHSPLVRHGTTSKAVLIS